MTFEVVGKEIKEEIDGDHLSVVKFDQDPDDLDSKLDGLIVEVQDEKDVCIGIAYLSVGTIIRKKK